MEEEVNELYAQFEVMELNSNDDDFDPNQLQNNFYELLEKVQELQEIVWENKDKNKLEKLEIEMIAFKSEQNFYNAEDELNRMFPNRGDDDFDEDSTSYDRVFGGD